MGRADQDPSMNWYHGEIGFFDYYVIPLAKKLKECGVFGVSSDEYLNYALQNREEWVTRGEEIINDMMRKNRKYSNKRPNETQSGGDINRSEPVQLESRKNKLRDPALVDV
jgi:hypothetical protein